jgi:glyoxylate utilization-related uncharacterized protein
MPKCYIQKEEALESGISKYHVTFEADDGYQEPQVYQCTEENLKKALNHFNDTHLAKKVEEKSLSLAIEEQVIELNPSKEAIANLKKIADIENLE